MSIRLLSSIVALFAAGVAQGQGGGVGGGRGVAGEVVSVAGQDAAAMMARIDERTRLIRPCPRVAPGELVVCARRWESDVRYRLPLPNERDRTGRGPMRGDAPRATAEPVRAGGCGVIGGQPYGCTGGLPVIGAAMLVGRIIMGLADPDRDHEPPPPVPARSTVAGEH